jgi:molybdopterin converting factor small subunit
MTPEEKAALEKRAANRGVSSGEYIRLAVDNFEKVTDEQEAELAALVQELAAAGPKIRASLERSTRRINQTVKELDTMLRDAGVRK